MVAKPLIDSLSALTVEQRIEVLDWLHSNLESSDIPGAHRRVLDSRLDAYEADPTAFDEMSSELALDHDVASIRQSMNEIDEGRGLSIDQMHQQLRSELLALQAARNIEK